LASHRTVHPTASQSKKSTMYVVPTAGYFFQPYMDWIGRMTTPSRLLTSITPTSSTTDRQQQQHQHNHRRSTAEDTTTTTTIPMSTGSYCRLASLAICLFSLAPLGSLYLLLFSFGTPVVWMEQPTTPSSRNQNDHPKNRQYALTHHSRPIAATDQQQPSTAVRPPLMEQIIAAFVVGSSSNVFFHPHYYYSQEVVATTPVTTTTIPSSGKHQHEHHSKRQPLSTTAVTTTPSFTNKSTTTNHRAVVETTIRQQQPHSPLVLAAQYFPGKVETIHHVSVLLPWLFTFVFGVLVPAGLSLYSFWRQHLRATTRQQRQQNAAAKQKAAANRWSKAQIAAQLRGKSSHVLQWQDRQCPERTTCCQSSSSTQQKQQCPRSSNNNNRFPLRLRPLSPSSSCLLKNDNDNHSGHDSSEEHEEVSWQIPCHHKRRRAEQQQRQESPNNNNNTTQDPANGDSSNDDHKRSTTTAMTTTTTPLSSNRGAWFHALLGRHGSLFRRGDSAGATTANPNDSSELEHHNAQREPQHSNDEASLQRQQSNADNNKNDLTRSIPGTCAICLHAFAVGHEICTSQNEACIHAFHVDCVASWLVYRQQAWDCPCCRQVFLPGGCGSITATT